MLGFLCQLHSEVGRFLSLGTNNLAIYFSILELTTSPHKPFLNVPCKAHLIKSLAPPVVIPNLRPLGTVTYLAFESNTCCCAGKFFIGSSIVAIISRENTLPYPTLQHFLRWGITLLGSRTAGSYSPASSLPYSAYLRYLGGKTAQFLGYLIFHQYPLHRGSSRHLYCSHHLYRPHRV